MSTNASHTSPEAMTTGRVVGPPALDRFGRVRMLLASAVAATIGVAIVVWSGDAVFAVVGIVLWGLGAALGFPVGMSAASDDPLRSARRVSVVSTLGYGAFLGGPPLLGFVGDQVGTLHSLLVVGAAMVPAAISEPTSVQAPIRTTPSAPNRSIRCPLAGMPSIEPTAIASRSSPSEPLDRSSELRRSG